MPDVFEFLRSVYLQPEAHQYLRAYFEYNPREDLKVMNEESISPDGTVPFDRLPLNIQAALMRDKGCEPHEFRKFKEICAREKAQLN